MHKEEERFTSIRAGEREIQEGEWREETPKANPEIAKQTQAEYNNKTTIHVFIVCYFLHFQTLVYIAFLTCYGKDTVNGTHTRQG